ncbi:MAG: PAS domain S-box protein [Dehalococcoidia bacterium]
MDTPAHTDSQGLDEHAVARLFDQAPDGIIFADVEGTIRAWNAAAERIFGFAPGDAIGQNLDIIIPEAFRERHWAGFERALAEKRTKYEGQALPTRATTASGDTIYVELSFAIVLDEEGEALGALAHARDITERFERDRAQRRRVAELERRIQELGGEVPG